MPLEEDPAKVRNSVVQKMTKLAGESYKKWSDFVDMRNLVVSRLTIFNARCGRKGVRLTVKEWKDAEKNLWEDTLLVQHLDEPLEKKSLLHKYTLA